MTGTVPAGSNTVVYKRERDPITENLILVETPINIIKENSRAM